MRARRGPTGPAISAEPEIAQAVVGGEGAVHLSALVVPSGPGVARESLAKAVARANARLPGYARIRDWSIVPAFTVENGRLTATGRPRRERIFADLERDMTRERDIHGVL